MKETEFETALYASIEKMKEEFKVMANALDLEKDQNKSNNESIKKLKDQVQSLQKDLELEKPRYGGDSTRKLARDAYNQSTVSANWEGLEEHPVITNIYASLKDTKTKATNRFGSIDSLIQDIPTFADISKDLESTAIMLGIKADIRTLDDRTSNLCVSLDADRITGSKQDHKIRDQIADLVATQNTFEFLLSETNDMFMNGMMFSIGAFATMGYEKIGEGIREIINKPKEQKKK